MLGSGCSTYRSNVAGLIQKEQVYFNSLHQLLATNRSPFESSLALQLASIAERKKNLLEWERHLALAEILLQVDANTKGNNRLLLTKLTEADIADHERWMTSQQIDVDRLRALLKLYDSLVRAVEAVRDNNKVLIGYLSSGDAEFALRSLDVSAVARATNDLRDVREGLQVVEKRSSEQKTKDYEALNQKIERARSVVLKGLKQK
jgi:hypothetical protein